MEEERNMNENPEEETWECFSSVGVEVDIDDVFGCFGFKDKKGNIRIEPQYLSCGEFHHGLCPVALGRTWYRTVEGRRYYEMHWGYIDKTGKVVIPFKYREAWNFNKYGVAVVCDEYTGNDYLIDVNGKKIENMSYPHVSHYHVYEERFIEFATTREADDGTVGLYDTKERKVVYPPVADSFAELDENCIQVDEYDAKGFGYIKQHYINANGDELYPWLVNKGYSFVQQPNQDGLAIISIAEFHEVQNINEATHFYRDLEGVIKHLYGVADKTGSLVIPAEYDSIKEIGNGVYECKKGEGVFLLGGYQDE